MRKLLILGSGLVFTLLAVLLFFRAGIPTAVAALVLWMVGGVIGISLMQFAFLGCSIRRSARVAGARPLRSFLVGILVIEIPVLAASCFRLAGAEELATLALLLFFGALLVLLWPANVALLIGEKLAPQEDQSRQVAVGSLVAATSMLVPIAGWTWLFYLACLSTGGFCLRGRYA